MMSRTGLRNWCPLATPVLLMAANAPDVDFVSILGGDPLILAWHRGPTHAVFFTPLVALLPLLPMLIFARRKMRWGQAYLVSVIGVLSHIGLDWTNIYGVRLLEPFSHKYYHLDISGVTDLWMLGVLLAAAAWFVISRLVNAEIGARRTNGRPVAVAALLFVCLWQGGRYFLHERARAVLDARLYDGAAATQVAALPHIGSPLRWTGLVETERAFRLFELDLASNDFNPDAGHIYYKAEPQPAIEAARKTAPFQRFLNFSHYALWRVVPIPEPEGALRVEALDLRFAVPGDGHFVSTAIVDKNGQVERAWFQFDPPGEGPRFK